MLGLLLTSVFFMFSMRQRLMLGAQRDTVAIQNTKMLLESYANYLEKFPKEITTLAGGKIYGMETIDKIYTKLTQKTDTVEGMIDAGETKSHNLEGADGTLFMEWNQCGTGQKGDLLINGVVYGHVPDSVCEDYDDSIGPINVSSGFTIATLNEPFNFRVRGAEGTQVLDNLWHLELSKDLGYGKKITIKKSF